MFADVAAALKKTPAGKPKETKVESKGDAKGDAKGVDTAVLLLVDKVCSFVGDPCVLM